MSTDCFVSSLKPELAQEIVIIDVKGKGEYKNWKILFESFGLQVFFLCDFDNAFTLKYDDHKTLLDRVECEKIKKQNTNDYPAFVCEVKNKFPDTDKIIESLYKDNIFILKQGEIENYIGLTKPDSGIEDFINFCETKMEAWANNSDTYFLELKTILTKITN